ncbi:energy transducer TonB [Flavobacteriaceae bacterium S0825]|uniref:hypothetical protein n=1 Tax=Gaetbulibacter sp. S0825 TaxID=2720084 RepID=UPI001431069E|nr:hypothetical protein [Gaetbulibacter sp. S0825]MCK0107798.1 energy transducer TonB [Flavobacteriaceae bacterium S0825]NIX63434.1 hypothetical protein [Gaetbulibacter sp. S0825]
MKQITFLVIMLLMYSANVISQEEFTQATFKEGDAQKFITSKFYMFNGNKATGDGTVTISFTINEKGEVIDVIPEINSSKTNGLNAMLAVQKTNGLWNPTLIDGKEVSYIYKIKFHFINKKGTFSEDYRKAKRLNEKGKYEKALKMYNKFVEKYTDEAKFYYERAAIKEVIGDEKGAQLDLRKFDELNRTFLAHIKVGLFAVERRKMMYKEVRVSGESTGQLTERELKKLIKNK